MITYVNMITHTYSNLYMLLHTTHTHVFLHALACVYWGCSSLRLKWAIVVDPTYSTLQEDRDIHQNQDLTNPKWGVIMIHST